jgi:hypothetical protein
MFKLLVLVFVLSAFLVVAALVVGGDAPTHGLTSPPPVPSQHFATLSTTFAACSDVAGVVGHVAAAARAEAYLHPFELARVHPCCVIGSRGDAAFASTNAAAAAAAAAAAEDPAAVADPLAAAATAAQPQPSSTALALAPAPSAVPASPASGASAGRIPRAAQRRDALPPSSLLVLLLTGAGREAHASAALATWARHHPYVALLHDAAPPAPLAATARGRVTGAKRQLAGIKHWLTAAGAGTPVAPPDIPTDSTETDAGQRPDFSLQWVSGGPSDAPAHLRTDSPQLGKLFPPAPPAAAAAAGAAASAAIPTNSAAAAPANVTDAPSWVPPTWQFALIVPDDSWVALPSLLSSLAAYSPGCPLALAHARSHTWLEADDHPALSAGLILSRAAAARLAEALLTPRCPYYLSRGVSLGRCLWATGAQLVHLPGLSPLPPRRSNDRLQLVALPEAVEALSFAAVRPVEQAILTEYVAGRRGGAVVDWGVNALFDASSAPAAATAAMAARLELPVPVAPASLWYTPWSTAVFAYSAAADARAAATAAAAAALAAAPPAALAALGPLEDAAAAAAAAAAGAGVIRPSAVAAALASRPAAAGAGSSVATVPEAAEDAVADAITAARGAAATSGLGALADSQSLESLAQVFGVVTVDLEDPRNVALRANPLRRWLAGWGRRASPSAAVAAAVAAAAAAAAPVPVPAGGGDDDDDLAMPASVRGVVSQRLNAAYEAAELLQTYLADAGPATGTAPAAAGPPVPTPKPAAATSAMAADASGSGTCSAAEKCTDAPSAGAAADTVAYPHLAAVATRARSAPAPWMPVTVFTLWAGGHPESPVTVRARERFLFAPTLAAASAVGVDPALWRHPAAAARALAASVAVDAGLIGELKRASSAAGSELLLLPPPAPVSVAASGLGSFPDDATPSEVAAALAASPLVPRVMLPEHRAPERALRQHAVNGYSRLEMQFPPEVRRARKEREAAAVAAAVAAAAADAASPGSGA